MRYGRTSDGKVACDMEYPHEFSEAPPPPVSRRFVVKLLALFHKAEVCAVLFMLVVALNGAVFVGRELIVFSAFWGAVCIAAAAVSLWPRAPRGLTILCEAVLVAVV